ncbi:Zn-binding domain-containing protein [Cyanothece sp. BG0011]|uniref:Zn-binding domain-containing protein n=1 Tax=Cyanothece sp. BG0011 TaxID=2082950 RepID=UPI001E5FDA8C|nr:DUF1998 domain-containing protein [Cyanothece sp. BG0011]
MLHSFSHLLITAIALDCGYAASSIRERIYAGESGYGILLFTGTTGSEGTLGGLVKIGDRFEDYLKMALELGRLCSNDPVCAQHNPNNEHLAQKMEQKSVHILETCATMLVVATHPNVGITDSLTSKQSSNTFGAETLSDREKKSVKNKKVGSKSVRPNSDLPNK